MKRFALGLLLGSCLAVGVYFYLHLYAMIILIGLLPCWYWRKHFLAVFFIAIIIGFSWTSLLTYYRYAQDLPIEDLHHPVQVIARVVSLPESHNNISRVELAVSEINHKKKSANILLYWFHPYQSLHVGQQWSLWLKLKPAKELGVQNGIDEAKFLFAQNIQAKAYLVPGHKKELISTSMTNLYLLHLREILLNAMNNSLGNQSAANLIPGLTVGYRGTLTPEQWQILQVTGTEHLMAIAGLHVGIVTGLLFFMTNYAWRIWPRCMLWVPSQVVAAYIAVLGALAYSALAGFSLATQRALIMAALVFFSIILRRKIILWQAYCSALILLLLMEPLSILSVRFWLSFSAVGVIIYYFQQRERKSWWNELIQLQFVIALGVLPISLYVFHETALLSPFINLLAIPWVGFIVVPIALLGCLCWAFAPSFSQALWWFAMKNMQFLWYFLQSVATQSWTYWMHSLSLFALFLAMLGVLLLLSVWRFSWRALGLLILLVALLLPV